MKRWIHAKEDFVVDYDLSNLPDEYWERFEEKRIKRELEDEADYHDRKSEYEIISNSQVEEYDADNKPDLPERPEEITNDYLNILFKRIDWDDIDYGDRLIDRVIKKELGVDRIFDQAKYINMLDDNVKEDLMSLLENPDELHKRRMKGKKKSASRAKKSTSEGCELHVRFEDYPDGDVKEATFKGTDRLDALKQLVDDLLLYIDTDQIESDEMSADDVINAISERNGDGCDYIIKLVDKSNNEVLMDYPFEEEDY